MAKQRSHNDRLMRKRERERKKAIEMNEVPVINT